MRLIDADALKFDIMCVYGSNPKYLNWLNHAPTVDAAPAKTGTWAVEHDPNDVPFMQTKYRCSACGGWNTYGKTKYCPNCGARMVEECG